MIEEYILQHLQEQAKLKSYLASYNGLPAVFLNTTPSELDPAWDEERHFSQLILHLAMQDDPQRQAKSRLTVEILSEKNSQPEYALIDAVRESLDGWFFAEAKKVISAQWMSMESIEGKTIVTFQVTEYQDQTLFAENPAALLSEWSKEHLPEILGTPCYLLGRNDVTLQRAFKPSEEKPAIYWRLYKTGKCETFKGGSGTLWRSGIICGHIIVPGNSARADAIAIFLEHALLRESRIEGNGSFVLIGESQGLDLTQSPAQTGQLTVEAIYPITADKPACEKLQHVSVAMKERE